ncbi:Non-specific serine/threonine protein kinase protein [Dioscorea alata]|uniref:Non-specific serine/threonine protein kinase protein n=1 Tax=Dioscorea alata TaxID=55571 RepID=A0ACB7UCW0_DIOAL|nr:Non-specific serine/threonine protein kinase protein [Dioscorea alata]
MNSNPNTELQALLLFKSVLSYPSADHHHHPLSSWNISTSVSSSLHNHQVYCQWRGITCGRRHLRVIALELGSLNLTGTVSPFIANLTFLRRLHLANNQLLGHIPPELGHLRHLSYLNLSFNFLEGQIPTSLSHCSLLETLSLRANKLQGDIPRNLSSCFNLQVLALDSNNFTGELANEFGSLLKLQKLVLRNNQLTGMIPPLLGSSPSLVVVHLRNNSFSGPIPTSLAANSSSLQILILSFNFLTGDIPLSLINCSSLTLLDLSYNALTGEAPSFMQADHSHLSHISFSGNNLTGGIPASLGNLSSLVIVYLAQNTLQGSIPEDLGKLYILKELDLNRNSLSDNIPLSLFNISSLSFFDLSYNLLSGALPNDMGHTLPNLQNFILRDNRLGGSVPNSLCNASGLQSIDIAGNSLSGLVPSNLGSLRGLQELIIAQNELHNSQDWSFLNSLINCTLLKGLFLQDNKLDGSLPRSVGNLSSQLEWLIIGQNQISGTIPDEIGNLANLTYLDLEENFFTGSIPATIGKLQKLTVAHLRQNNFSGMIPFSVGNLTWLYELDLSDNQLWGQVPASLGRCGQLAFLNLSYNQLGGEIPGEVVSLTSLTQLLDLSHNLFTGSIPTEAGRLKNLGQLDLSNNQLSGSVPPSLGDCLVLENLSLQHNFFSGRIPQSFSALRGIVKLDLSSNNFSGEIPDFLGKAPFLKYLNLSFNDLEGQVPQGIITSNASEIYVYGNPKLCCDNEKLQLPSCSVVKVKKRYNKMIMIPVATILSLIILVLLSYKIYLKKKTRGNLAPAKNSSDDEFRKVSYKELSTATDGFSSENLIGAGSFGSVYKGKMDGEDDLVAVKVLNLNQKGALKSFMAECKALRNIRHRNLVKIITLCSSLDSKGNEFKALVYEFMPNGTLDQWLHNQHTSKLNIIQRLDIAINVASALDYLHNQCKSLVIHCDLKPNNVLLDDHMIAHVSDFGLARLICMESNSMTSTDSSSFMGMKGSIGYVPPEYGMGSQVSTQGDVYSFGILLLEMLTGRRPTDEMFGAELNIHKYAEKALSENVMELIDPQMLTGEEDEDITMISRCAASLTEIGVSCSRELPNERMEIRNVVIELEMIRHLFQ